MNITSIDNHPIKIDADLENSDWTKQPDLPFPDCYETCEAAQLLGVGECESICPHKFKREAELEEAILTKQLEKEN
jgi:hypothetical protein